MYALLLLGSTDYCVVDLDQCIGGTYRLVFKPYLLPHAATTAIQCAYRSSVYKEWEWQQQKLSWAGYALECNMNRATRDLRDSDTFVFLVGAYYWMPCLHNG